MKLKVRPTDFRVDELLHEDYLGAKGPHRVYRLKKQKLTSLEAAATLADLAGVSAGEVSLAGLKDRQGVTTQYMSILKGREVELEGPPLRIETVGFAGEALDSAHSLGNSFRLVLRDLDARELELLREALPEVREHGLPNYFDEQRFGNLRHQQGWIVLDILRKGPEEGLKRILTAVSPFDDEKHSQLKSALWRHWGDWRACREIAGRFGAHHSVFEHLRKSDGDFAGAFRHVAASVRLIHLFAFQSHLWNRAVARWIERVLPVGEQLQASSPEGRLVFARQALPIPEAWRGQFPLTGARLEGVHEPDQRALYQRLLERLHLSPDDLAIEGVSGFALKSEPRELVLRPLDLRLRPAEPDNLHPGKKQLRLSFDLPRGAYATLVVRRLLATARPGRRELRPSARPEPERRPRRGKVTGS